jgi:hypothetical protein
MDFQKILLMPVWQMTGEELLFLQNNALHSSPNVKHEKSNNEKRYEYGIRGIAKIFDCSIPTANRIKKSGKIDEAITQIGRKIIVDVDLALMLANRRTSK